MRASGDVLATSCAATCAPLNPAYRASEFDFYLADLRASAVLVQHAVESPVRDVARARGIPVIEVLPCLKAEAGGVPAIGVEQQAMRSLEATFRVPVVESYGMTSTLQNLFESSYLTAKAYNPRLYPGPRHVFRAEERSGLGDNDPLDGWQALAVGGVEVFDVPGSHVTMTTDPYAQELAEAIRHCLERSTSVIAFSGQAGRERSL